MRRLCAAGAVALFLTLASTRVAVTEEKHRARITARLTGYQETPLTLSTTGNGDFVGRLNEDRSALEYKLTYSDLTGGNVLFAHIHLGRPAITGGVMAFLCGGGGKPACPPAPATVTGTIDASNIVGPAGQGVSAGEFGEFLKAIRTGNAYANVHTTMYPGGEIRGQIKVLFRHHHDDFDDHDHGDHNEGDHNENDE
jgi:hypothetical protein